LRIARLSAHGYDRRLLCTRESFQILPTFSWRPAWRFEGARHLDRLATSMKHSSHEDRGRELLVGRRVSVTSWHLCHLMSSSFYIVLQFVRVKIMVPMQKDSAAPSCPKRSRRVVATVDVCVSGFTRRGYLRIRIFVHITRR
jgi:hypothetical protein